MTTLPGTTIETKPPTKVSSAGGAPTRQRRDSSFPFRFKISSVRIFSFHSFPSSSYCNFFPTSNNPSIDKSKILLFSVDRSINLLTFAILVVRPSHRFPSKSNPASSCSYSWKPTSFTKCFTWMRLDRSSALTMELMKHTPAEE